MRGRRVVFLLACTAIAFSAGTGTSGPAEASSPTPHLPTAVPGGAPSPDSSAERREGATASDRDEAVSRLADELEALLERARWRSTTWGVLVTSLDNGETLFSWNADSLLAPASNMKLLTSAAAFRVLGPEYRFRTYLLTTGSVRDGVLEGDLVLYGTGDPGISDRFYPSRTFVFEALVRELRETGVRRIRGNLVADASFLPGPLRPEGWDPRDLNEHFAPGISALSYNENVLSLRLEPGPAPGLPPVVHTLPDYRGVPVENLGVTVDGAARPRLSITRSEPLGPFRIEGEIRRGGRDVWRQMTVSRPARFAGASFREILREGGVELEGDLRVVDDRASSLLSGPGVTAPIRDGRPRTRVLARHVSPPLREYLAVVNKRSNNLFAELAFRTMGRVREGRGDAASGARAVEETLRELGVEAPGLVQLDGSGLSEGNRVAPSTFVSLLRRVSETPLWAELWQTLPEAGRRRELPRMYRTAASGNLRAKTGTIARVSALTGVVRSAQGERLAFSILVNGTPSTSRAKSVENTIGARLASFSRQGEAPVRRAQLPPPLPSPERGGPIRHRVASGENLGLIARRYGLTLEELLEANPGVEPTRIRAGSVLLIPPAEVSGEVEGQAGEARPGG